MQPLPHLTPDLPGVGGRIKAEFADFDVEEIPAYEPSGQGEHLYLWIEKTDLGAEYFARQISRRLGIGPGDVGMAGLKDRRAVTRQWVSLPGVVEERLADLEGDGIRVLKVSRHGNKLRPGHLHGNRFRVLIRDAVGDPTAIIAVLEQLGMPNFYGEQRFGHDGETLQMGLNLLRGEKAGRVSHFQRKLALSAVQSMVFNEVLSQRMNDELFRTVLDGDVMTKWPAGGMFTSTDKETDQKRFDIREIIHAGPMPGKKMFRTTGQAAEREDLALTALELKLEMFNGFGSLLDGTRRMNLVYPGELATETTPEGLVVKATLPAGSYMTVLLREVMKSESAAPSGLTE